MQDFKTFLFRGNVVDLAVAVVIGTAFTAVVTAFVKDMITPLIAAIVGKPNFSDLTFTVHKSHFAYGDVINYLITFVSVAAVVFFLVVKPMEVLQSRRAQEDPTVKECPQCATDIPIKAKRCPLCTSQLEAAPGPA